MLKQNKPTQVPVLLSVLLLVALLIFSSGCVSSSPSCKTSGTCDPKLCPENCLSAPQPGGGGGSIDSNSQVFEHGDDVRITNEKVCYLYEQKLETSADLHDGYVIVPDAFGHLKEGPQDINGTVYWFSSDWTNFGGTFSYAGWVSQDCFEKVNTPN